MLCFLRVQLSRAGVRIIKKAEPRALHLPLVIVEETRARGATTTSMAGHVGLQFALAHLSDPQAVLLTQCMALGLALRARDRITSFHLIQRDHGGQIACQSAARVFEHVICHCTEHLAERRRDLSIERPVQADTRAPRQNAVRKAKSAFCS